MPTLMHSEPLAESNPSVARMVRRDLIRMAHWLYRLGFAPGTAGNLSLRLDEDTLLVTPSGVSKAVLRSRDLLVVDTQGHLLEGTRNPTTELGMHLAFYQERPDVQGVIHAHPPVATAFACSGRALDQLICQEAAMTLGPVPLACYATTGTDEVAASLRPFIPCHDAILLANHGAVTCGSSLSEAFFRMETLEHLAQIRLAAEQLGACQPLAEEQLVRLRMARERYLRRAAESDVSEVAAEPLILA